VCNLTNVYFISAVQAPGNTLSDGRERAVGRDRDSDLLAAGLLPRSPELSTIPR